jgi:tetratricopeptide (TPR) repeat protein
MMALCAALALLLPSGAPARNPALDEEERVTAVDVFVELDGDGPEGRIRSLPKGLGLEDFQVRVGGEPRSVVGFFDPRAVSAAEARRLVEPWDIVLYFDLTLAERDTVRWAAAELAELVPELVKLGDVELVVAGEGSSRFLASNRDAELLEGELAEMVAEPEGAHAVLELRGEVLEALREAPEDVLASDVGLASVEEEVSLIGRHLDRLLIHLTDRRVGGSKGLGSKRVLFWVSDGFDVEPAEFYRAQGLEVASSAPSLRLETGKLAMTLASYGWVTFGISPPLDGPGLVPGFRIGKWLFSSRIPPAKGIGGTLIREERRDPEKARAHVAIGEALLKNGDPDSARQSFELALYHFAGDPRTREDQAAAKAGLGLALEAQGNVAEARQAFHHAVELDPELASEYPQARPRLLRPLEFQTRAAMETAGRIVQEHEVLLEAVASLSRRARLTYQISGWPQGGSKSLEIALKGSELGLYHPKWARSGDLATLAAARARQLVHGALDEGGLKVRARLDPVCEKEGALVVTVDRGLFEWEEERERDRSITLRLTVATGGVGTVPVVRQKQFEVAISEASDGGPMGATTEAWLYREPVAELADDEWIAVIVEELETGRWGGDLAD